MMRPWQIHYAEYQVSPLYLTQSRGCAGSSGAAAALQGSPLPTRTVQPTSLCPLQAQPFTGGLPAQQTLPITGEKQHQVLRNVLDNLTNVMNGYCLPEPYFKTKVGARHQIFHPVATRASPAAPASAPAGGGMGGTADEDPAGPCPAPAGAAGDHDEHFGKNPAGCGEIHPEGDGPVCQQHHLCALPLPQPAGEWQRGLTSS